MKINHAEIAKILLTDEEYTIELKDLVGEFVLTGVDTDSTQYKSEWQDGYEDCNTLSFIFNDITFTAIEDPDDGYRSSMRKILVEKFIIIYQSLKFIYEDQWGYP